MLDGSIEISERTLVIGLLIFIAAFLVMLAIMHANPQYFDDLGDRFLGPVFYGREPQSLLFHL